MRLKDIITSSAILVLKVIRETVRFFKVKEVPFD